MAVKDFFFFFFFFFFFCSCVRQALHQIFRSSDDANWAVRRRSSTVPHSLVAMSVLFGQVFLHRSPQFGGHVCVVRPGFPPPFPTVWWPDLCCSARFSDAVPRGVGRFREHGLGSGLMFHMDTEMLLQLNANPFQVSIN